MYTEDISRLESIFTEKINRKARNEFEVFIYKDDTLQKFHEEYLEKLQFLLDERSVFRVEKAFMTKKSRIQVRFKWDTESA